MPRFDDFLDEEEDDMDDSFEEEDESDSLFRDDGFDSESKVSEIFDSIIDDLTDEELETLHGLLSDYLGK